MEQVRERFDKWFRRIAFGLLLVLSFTIVIGTFVSKNSYDKENSLKEEYGIGTEIVKDHTIYNATDVVYGISKVLCIISIINFAIYFGQRFFVFKDIKFDKKKIKPYWPMIVLAVFLIWSSVGTIQLFMEVDAETKIRSTENIEDVPERLIKIANWTSGDRASNAINRVFEGNVGHKNGLKTIFCYITVFLNAFIVGLSSKKSIKWVLRSLLVSSFIMAIFVYIAFFLKYPVQSVVYWQRMIFSHFNTFGYYISVVLMLAIMEILEEDNIFFKVFACINYLIYLPILIACNTFGAYLGILAGIIFAGVILLYKFIKERSKANLKQLIKYVCILIPFIIISSTICGYHSDGYTSKEHDFTYSSIELKLFGKKVVYSFNTVSQEQAEEYGIENFKVSGKEVLWGNQRTTYEDEEIETFVEKEFSTLFSDIGSMLGFVEEKIVNNDETSNKEDEEGASDESPAQESSTNSNKNDKTSTETKVEDTKKTETTAENKTTETKKEEATATNKTTETKKEEATAANKTTETKKEETTAANKTTETKKEEATTANKTTETKKEETTTANKTTETKKEETTTTNKATETKNTAETTTKELDKYGLDKSVSNAGSGRGKLWVKALELINQRPWFGWGIENSLNEFKNQFGINDARAHNLILQFSIVTGAPALITYLFIITLFFLKAIFDVKLRSFNKKGKLIIAGVYVVATIIFNLILTIFTTNMFIRMLGTAILYIILYAGIFIKSIKFKLETINSLDFICCGVFVSYMTSSMFGNTSFGTTPLFLIVAGYLGSQAINKNLQIYNESQETKKDK